jgi:hypothetical protein
MSKDDKKEEDQVQKGVAQEPGEEVVIENFRYCITAKTLMAIEGSVKFDDLAIRCDDAYVAADPENHKSDIQEARIVLRDSLEVAPILTNGVIRVEGKMIFKEASA